MGITPACAGKSRSTNVLEWGFKDHPRVCGEKAILELRLKLSVGSPPRVRGKAMDSDPTVDMERITPACAGKSVESQQPERDFEDHPRVCGEKLPRRAQSPPQLGSPPRVRGKVLLWRGI